MALLGVELRIRFRCYVGIDNNVGAGETRSEVVKGRNRKGHDTQRNHGHGSLCPCLTWLAMTPTPVRRRELALCRVSTLTMSCVDHTIAMKFSLFVEREKKMRWSYVGEYADKDQMNHIKDIKKKNYQA